MNGSSVDQEKRSNEAQQEDDVIFLPYLRFAPTSGYRHSRLSKRQDCSHVRMSVR
jgi:hypothetical protein